jgi:CRISPR-associated protein Cas6
LVAHIDLFFQVIGELVPLDHGFALYSAICKATEETPGGSWLHGANDVGLIPIRGTPGAAHQLILNRQARFGLRMPAADIPRALTLAGRRLRLAGTTIRAGTTTAEALIPASTLYARIVTTRNGEDESRFDTEITRQLGALGIHGRPIRGARRVVRIHEKKIIGHELLVTELTAGDSIVLQEKGLGGRRKMGCGVFQPRSTPPQ